MMSSIHIDPKGPRCLALVFIILMLPFPASPLLALAHQSSNLLHILLYFLYPHRLFFLCYELVFFFQHIHFEYSLRPGESTFSFVSFNSYSCSLRSLKTQIQYLHLFRGQSAISKIGQQKSNRYYSIATLLLLRNYSFFKKFVNIA